MKRLIISVALVSWAVGLQLQIGTQLTLDQAYQLACSNAQGPVTYEAQNLPQGVRLHNDKIELFDSSNNNGGYYPVKIRATDSSGSVDERIVVVVIRGGSASADSSVVYNTGGMFNSASNVVRTVTISESSSSSSGASSSGASASTASSGQSGNLRGDTASPQPLPQPDAGVASLLDSLQVPSGNGNSGNNGGSASPSPSSPAGSPAGSANPQSTDGSYPAMKFPTGGSQNAAPNVNPNLIASSRAPRTDTNRVPITADDIKTRAAFDRQINAAKALANLLSIVKQATANRNVAQQETITRQNLYD